ncbi:type II secretion system protein GspC [Shewanella sp. GXUN23E]|uniref:type II secretion system protein GspC n=1 Tax=Shewanella sp. GXUN23E TaxID=3422498 RepID=UPI003D7C5350
MDLLDKFFSRVSQVPQKPVSVGVFWLLVITALYLAAQISWKLVPSQPSAVVWQPTLSSVDTASGSAHSIESLKSLALFGKVSDKPKNPKPEPVAEIITDAPKTTLSIQLTGVVASTAERNGLAVIESRGSQDTYSLGDKISGTSASLKEVYADRVIITNNGRYETLMLDGLQYTTQSDANTRLQEAKVERLDQRDNKDITQELEYSRDLLLEDPGKITDFIAISPIRIDGEVAGYRLNPGKDPSLFKAAGFEPNDLAKSINGYDLTDMAQSIDVMAQLPTLTEVSVMVERQGQLVEILFSLPQQ